MASPSAIGAKLKARIANETERARDGAQEVEASDDIAMVYLVELDCPRQQPSKAAMPDNEDPLARFGLDAIDHRPSLDPEGHCRQTTLVDQQGTFGNTN